MRTYNESKERLSRYRRQGHNTLLYFGGFAFLFTLQVDHAFQCVFSEASDAAVIISVEMAFSQLSRGKALNTIETKMITVNHVSKDRLRGKAGNNADLNTSMRLSPLTIG